MTCIVYIHSSAEQCVKYRNGWDIQW